MMRLFHSFINQLYGEPSPIGQLMYNAVIEIECCQQSIINSQSINEQLCRHLCCVVHVDHLSTCARAVVSLSHCPVLPTGLNSPTSSYTYRTLLYWWLSADNTRPYAGKLCRPKTRHGATCNTQVIGLQAAMADTLPYYKLHLNN